MTSVLPWPAELSSFSVMQASPVSQRISECCYRYERKLSDENAEIAEWPPLGDCSNHLPVEV